VALGHAGRHLELVAHFLGLEHAAQVEPLDDLLHEALGRGTQPALAVLLARSARRAARILSRSVAITCMRWLRRSRDSTGISTVSAVAKAATAASSVTMICGVSSD
jgi:hypothetical protein